MFIAFECLNGTYYNQHKRQKYTNYFLFAIY